MCHRKKCAIEPEITLSQIKAAVSLLKWFGIIVFVYWYKSNVNKCVRFRPRSITLSDK